MKLHHTRTGKGDVIVLIHGFCENSTCFNEQVFLLSTNYTVITIDLPGHGQSAEPSPFTMAELADAIDKILITEQVQKCVMIGHSMGGYATLAFAKKYPAAISGIGLLHSTANADNDERKAKRDQAMAVIKEKGAPYYIHQFIPPLFAKDTDAEIVKKRIKENETITAQSLIACLGAMKNREDANEWIQTTNLPIAFFVGKHDALIPEKDMFAQAASAKVSKVSYLEKSAHMGMVEEPQKLATDMGDFASYCFATIG
jgi:pimeloyl-ACP methyl ester carboxylesterase